MKQGIYVVYKGLVWLILAVAVLQFFLANLGVFEATGFGPHTTSGFALVPVSLVLLVIAAVAAFTGSLSRGRVGMAARLLALPFVFPPWPRNRYADHLVLGLGRTEADACARLS